jgi:dihydrolipoamide dehydrogenase
VGGPFDLVVIGSGPGGYTAAIRAAQLGLRTACVEKYRSLGGTCLNVGCIPSKALLDSSEHFWLARHRFPVHGIRGTFELDLPAMMKRKDEVVRGLTSGVGSLFKKHSVTRLTGTGRIEGPGTVVVTNEGKSEKVSTKHILIATGSKPAALPGIAFDGRRIVHSTEGLALPEVPKRLLVIGAGAIGLELGSVWMRLGAEVQVFEFMDRITPGMHAPSAAILQRSLTRQGMKFTFGAAAESARVEGDVVKLILKAGEERREAEGDVLLVAVGRRPYTDGLGLKDVGVVTDPRGRIAVNERLETSVPGIFAIGDVIEGPMLAHKAEDEGIAAVERMAGMTPYLNPDLIPNVVYTAPEFASAGLTEEQARERGHEPVTGVFPFMANGRARALDERDGQVALVADARTDRLLGAHLVGPRASDLIAELVLGMELGASAEDVARTVHAHPTLTEAVREAALAVAKRTLNI